MKILLLLSLVCCLYGQTSYTHAQKLYDEGKYDRALEILKTLLDDEERSDYYILASKSAFELGKYEDAYDYIEETIDGEKDDVHLLRYYSEVMVRYSDEAGVFSQFSLVGKMKTNWENILQIDPDDQNVLKYLTRYHLFAPSMFGKDEEKGYSYLKRLQALNATEALNIKIEYLLEEDRIDEALSIVEQAGTDISYGLLKHKMDIYRRLNDLQKLNTVFSEIDTKHFKKEDISLVYNSYGYYLLSQKQYKAAIKVFERAVEKSPGKANPYDSLGDGYRALGKLDEARRCYRKALQIDPAFEASLKNLQELDE